MKVADLGVGAGFYVLTLARMVGEEGRVFAVDVQKELVAGIKRTAEKEGFANVEAIWGDIEKEGGTKIKEGALDACLVSDVLFQVEDKKEFTKEISRILKPGGKVLVVDWLGSFAGMGPSPNHIVSKEAAQTLFQAVGFSMEKEIKAGDHHYGFVMRKA